MDPSYFQKILAIPTFVRPFVIARAAWADLEAGAEAEAEADLALQNLPRENRSRAGQAGAEADLALQEPRENTRELPTVGTIAALGSSSLRMARTIYSATFRRSKTEELSKRAPLFTTTQFITTGRCD